MVLSFFLRCDVDGTVATTLSVSKKWTPETFYYNFVKSALISIKIGAHNMHMI